MIILLFSFNFFPPSKLQFHSRFRSSTGREIISQQSQRFPHLIVSASDILYLRLILGLIVVLLRSMLCRKFLATILYSLFLIFFPRSPVREDKKKTRLASEKIHTINLSFNRCLLERISA